MQEADVKNILTQFKRIDNTLHLLMNLSNATHYEKIKLLEKQKIIICSWLELLSEEERFVLERHLIYGLSWGKVSIEYEVQQGMNEQRHERTLKRYQSIALKKICRQIHENGLDNEIDKLFSDSIKKERE